MQTPKKFFVFLLAVLLYYFALIWRSSFIFQGKRYFVLFDDMMISMRYAHNLARGFGLVWNPGKPPVEGYSNFLWTVYMALFHLIPIPLNLTSFFIQATNALFLAATVVLVYKILKLLSKSALVTWGATIFTAFYFPLINWAVVLGTEVGVLTLLTTLLIYLYIKNNQITYVSILLITLGILTRMDFVTVTIGLLLFSYLADRESRRFIVVSSIFLGIGTMIGLGFRYSYYHDIFPNTYYLKTTGYPLLYRIARGIYVLRGLGNVFLFGGALLGAIFIKSRSILLLALLFFMQIIYSVFVGGDAWEFLGGANRYIAIVMPLFFVLFFLVVESGIKICKKTVQKNIFFKLGLTIFLIFSFLSFNSGNDNTLFQLLFLKAPLNRQDSIVNVQEAYDLSHYTNKQAVIAVSWAGIVPYFTDRQFVDFLGKNDRVLAHEPAHITGTGLRKIISFWPGHTKWDYGYSLGKLKPDVVVTVYPLEAALPYLTKYYEQKKLGKSYFYVKVND